MSATQAALDELDEATLELVLALQLEDVASITQQDGDDDSAAPDSAAVGQVFTEELLQYRAVRHFESEETHLAEAIAVAAANPGPPNIECTSCEALFVDEEVWQAPCSHHYCVPCLEHLHRASMTDETLYPPRCCRREMPWDDVRVVISERLATDFANKKEELDTHIGNRTYCSDANCSVFIGADHTTNDVATCPTCDQTTCTMCKAARHDGDCPADAALQQTLLLATDRGWQRCARCRSIIDLAFGCYHITCACRHEFCYVCGANWKTCDCPQWDEERLEARAEVVVDREPAAAAEAPDQRADRVAQEMQHLRERHNCAHEQWVFSRGAGVCEECTWLSHFFTMECVQCRLRACRRCMQNRL